MRPVKEQVCQYLMWRKSRPENKISAEVEEKVENAIQVKLFIKYLKFCGAMSTYLISWPDRALWFSYFIHVKYSKKVRYEILAYYYLRIMMQFKSGNRSGNSIEVVWIFQELFWKLVKLRVKPDNERITVLIHGAVNLDNIMFSYDELSGRPNQV